MGRIKVFFPPPGHVAVRGYHDFLYEGLRTVANVEIDSNIPKVSKPKCAVFAIDFMERGKRIRAWYDWTDFTRTHLDLVGPKDVYFKIELDKKDLQPRVYSIGQITDPLIFEYQAKWRREKDSKKYDCDVYANMRVTDYKMRLLCIQTVKAQKKGWKLDVGLRGRVNRPVPPAGLSTRRLSLPDTYSKQCHSRICLAVRGIGEKTWRHMEILGMGCCLLMHETTCAWPANLSGCAIVVKRDFSDMVERIEYYLSHGKEREEIAKAGADYYDKWLSPKAQAKYMIQRMRKHLDD